MAEAQLSIHMLGNFSLQYKEQRISNLDNRSRKVWLLLAYLIYNRKRSITSDDLLKHLWTENDVNVNPASTLKTTLHRARACLDQLYPGAGHELILHRNHAYTWNTDIPLNLDIDEFDTLCQEGMSVYTDNEKLSIWMRALALYQGDFLEKLSAADWVTPISTYFHNRYLEILSNTVTLLYHQSRWSEISSLCQSALSREPYDENLCRHLMNAYAQLGQQQNAAQVYESLSKGLLSSLGILPSDETRALYRNIIRTDFSHIMSSEEILDSLHEAEEMHGTMFCEYDFFRIIFQSTVRLLTRNQSCAHLVVFTLQGLPQKELSRRSLELAVQNLITVIRLSLRRSDIMSQCSASQIIVLLPEANYENSLKICKRICNRFYQQYPKAAVRLSHAIYAPKSSIKTFE